MGLINPNVWTNVRKKIRMISIFKLLQKDKYKIQTQKAQKNNGKRKHNINVNICVIRY
jgi:hypothetical protein